MLSARACRLLGYGGSSGSAEPAAARTTAARLDGCQRLARWKIFLLKALLVIVVFENQRKALVVLGTDSYKRLVYGYEAQNDRLQNETQGPTLTNIINREIVGKPLKPGDGPVTVDPVMCAHPTASMKRRGNKMKWWTCVQCQSRWERQTLGEIIPEGVSPGLEIRLQGAHMGLTFSDIYENHKSCCCWVLLAVEQG